jgi:hypothetical protein
MQREQLIAVIVAVALFMEQVDSTIIATALPAIAADLGTTPLQLNVAVTAYLLALAIFIPVSGWMADRFGARNVFRAAIIVFMTGSICCALRPHSSRSRSSPRWHSLSACACPRTQADKSPTASPLRGRRPRGAKRSQAARRAEQGQTYRDGRERRADATTWEAQRRRGQEKMPACSQRATHP